MTKIAQGIFCWDATERRSDRYGCFYVNDSSYDGKKTLIQKVYPSSKKFDGKRVKITIKVLENRPSGHIGDAFLGLVPDPLAAGKTLELAIGTLRIVKNYDGNPAFEVHPDKSRETFWIDPRNFYKLHDQTVEVHAELSDAPAHPVFTSSSGEDEVMGNGDGTFQAKTRHEGSFHVEPKITGFGGGMFSVELPTTAKGSRHRISR